MGKVTSSIAVDSGSQTWTFAQVDELSAELAKRFKEMGVRVLASLLDNSAAWVIVDRAALEAGVVHVPLPPFFTHSQILHAISTTGADTVLTESTGC
ncbi:MAG: long-chain fatty acid--CoA ligase [Comamonas sp.]|uniref:AMP-binding protein n=1 Tax=Comamonas sp. TaxID=34028 RepID=UPI0026492C4A|nr:AMP-binding protein [Comamonas sp.]MDN5507196.1 long-chain fatty acid--CoA ligase [Comamonas sp.]MDN5535413.1 long-chain fatty acid--CoA ligase [Comamonas sp.]